MHLHSSTDLRAHVIIAAVCGDAGNLFLRPKGSTRQLDNMTRSDVSTDELVRLAKSCHQDGHAIRAALLARKRELEIKLSRLMSKNSPDRGGNLKSLLPDHSTPSEFNNLNNAHEIAATGSRAVLRCESSASTTGQASPRFRQPFHPSCQVQGWAHRDRLENGCP